jgi:hypothetical protein
MKSTDENPNGNALPPGVSEEQVAQAIAKSGYPLQTAVAAELRKSFRVQEEWSYIDTDSESLRTIDILAEKYLYDPVKEHPRVRPTLNLLVECKQSDLPYIFFLSGAKVIAHKFPLLAGLFDDAINLKTDDSGSSWTMSILMVLDLLGHPFISDKNECCSTFSKCVRKGNDLELSGSEPFNALLLPILKAMQHFKKAEAPPKTARYFDCHLVVGLALLDAPMIGVRLSEQGEQASFFAPWIRVSRHESYENEDWTKRSSLYAVEIIHKQFFERYLNEHLFPFADTFSKLALKHDIEIASGQGFASGLMEKTWNVEPRLQPRK